MFLILYGLMTLLLGAILVTILFVWVEKSRQRKRWVAEGELRAKQAEEHHELERGQRAQLTAQLNAELEQKRKRAEEEHAEAVANLERLRLSQSEERGQD